MVLGMPWSVFLASFAVSNLGAIAIVAVIFLSPLVNVAMFSWLCGRRRRRRR
jgi:hypothetical protein